MDSAGTPTSDGLFLARAPAALAASTLVVAASAALFMWSPEGDASAATAAVLGVFLALAAARGLMLGFRAEVPSRRWWWAFTFAWLATAAIWGMAVGVLLAVRGMDPLTLFIVLPTAGLAAGIMSPLASRPRELRAHLVAMLVPPIIGALLSPERLMYRLGLALNISLLLVFLFVEVTRRHREILCARANVRELELHAHALDGARLQALEASHAKSNFLANMSHEIRTPLTAILGYAELLDDRHLDLDDRLAHARTVRTAGKHLLSLVNDVLDLAKIDAGKLKVELAPCSPIDVLAEVGSTLRVRASDRKLAFEMRSDGPLPATIRADTMRLTQILMNLVGNAIKFTDEGHVHVTAKCVDPKGATPRLVVSVSDTGIGMDEALRARLFTTFTQADSSSARRHGGAGLGLAISRELARLLGGDIEVEPNADGGSTFRLTIPTGPLDGVAFVDDLQIAPDSAGKERRLAVAAIRLAGTVLIADDSVDNQRLIGTLLRKAGATVSIADNGRVAVDMALAARAAGSPFGVILMDMQMPELDGIGATEQLRGAGYEYPIVALTAHAMPEQRVRCIAAGCDDFVTKPVERQRLFEVVRVHLLQEPAASHRRPAGPRLTSSLEGDPVLGELVAEYATALADRASYLEEALAKGDLENLSRAVHRLVAEGGTFGFPMITTTARRVEAAIADDDAPLIETHVRALVQLCLRVAA
jgi:signal transduction histidine kinase/DNA-binding response OmpR family regulator